MYQRNNKWFQKIHLHKKLVIIFHLDISVSSIYHYKWIKRSRSMQLRLILPYTKYETYVFAFRRFYLDIYTSVEWEILDDACMLIACLLENRLFKMTHHSKCKRLSVEKWRFTKIAIYIKPFNLREKNTNTFFKLAMVSIKNGILGRTLLSAKTFEYAA